MYLVGYLEIGQLDKAAAFFNKSWIPYVDKSTGNFGGDCGGNFLTGAGGFLQGLWAGWAGMRLRLDSLDFLSPRMPTTTSGVKLRGVTYRSTKFDVILGQRICFSAWPGQSSSLKIGVLGSGDPLVLLTTEPQCFSQATSLTVVDAQQHAKKM